MAVTTGKDTKTTSTGGGPSGGPGGPNGPNSGPSTGAGGQKNTSSPSASSSKPSSSSSKSSPSSSSGGKTSPSSKTSTSSPSSKTTSPSNPTGGSLQAPNRTASSSGITSRTPSQQSANDKLKQSATQYGGAQTSMRNATVTKSAPSAKVTDPSRGPSSPMSKQGTSFGSPAKAATANQKYIADSGFANRIKSDPFNRIEGQIEDLRGLQNMPAPRGYNHNPDWDKFNKVIREGVDAYYRGMKGIAGIDDDLRTPQEVREQVQRMVDRENRLNGEQARRDYNGRDIGADPRVSLNESIAARKAASAALDNASLTPSRTSNGLTGDMNNLWGATPQQRGLTAPKAPAQASYDPLSSIRTRAPSPVAQDPGVAGRAAQANQNYKTTSGPGGMVSRTYSDPDVAAAQQANQPSFTDRITRGLQGLNDSLQSAYGVPEAGPNRGLANPSVGQQLAAAASDAWNKIQSGAGSFIDNLMGQPLMGAQTVAAGPMTVDGSILGENRVFGPQNISQAITGDYPRAPFDAQSPIPTSMRVANPVRSVASTSPDQLAMEQIIQDPTNRTLSSAQGRAAFKEIVKAMTSPKAPATGKQITDRIAPTLDEKRQQVAQEMQQSRRTRGIPPATGSEGIQTGPQPEMSPEDVLPPAPDVPSDAIASGPVPDISTAPPSAPSVTSPGNAIPPSQEGDYPPDENFMQDDGQAQSYQELKNRYQYEKDRAVEGFKDLPGNLWNAIVNGDFRPYTGTENDKRMPYEPVLGRQAQQVDANAQQQAALVALLMSLIQNQSTGTTQADLINSTFI